MANKSPRSLRTASVGIRFPLARFHASLADVWNRSIERPGVPGTWDGLLTGELRQVGPDYLCQSLLDKFDDGKANPTKVENTWKRFHDAEDLCRDTNNRLARSGFRGPFEGTLERTRALIGRILGSFDWDSAADGMGWGPGASTRLPRRKSDAAYKYSGKPDSTVGNSVLAYTAIRRVPSWFQEVSSYAESPDPENFLNLVSGNRIVTVPKNYKTDRTIAIEPDMNMYIQKGIGALMRKRLRFAGCNLDDQTRNQRLAQVGSVAGSLATIDLSMASDTVSRQLVSRLLPEDWLLAMEHCRSPFGVLPSGEKIFYQKFSSMGNGFTFELESVIFYALALQWCIDHGEEVSRVSVYGDDIILPATLAVSFFDLLRFCGFSANDKKSYWTGPFRESCGKHFFRGHEITPFFVRRPVTRLTDLFLLHNNLFRYMRRSEWLDGEELLKIRHLLWWIRQYAPFGWRKPRLLLGFGDGAFVGDFDECTPKSAPGGLEAWVVDVLAEVPISDYIDVPGLMSAGLQQAGTSTLSDPLGKLRNHVSVYPVKGRRVRMIKLLIPQYAG